ncbi:uncharacterized protein PFL1_01084 [Pseudozyma flocculosa PF-1]|uniref:Related to Nuclease Le3 n=1 Tax=Pseudozyma flocculosa TaxID=84751 RepID=A0A5C3FBY4_9BASI|nr:uncharacterized protein PFL1_01084 [Pseudozyma flocculosa PF-1]EPQ31752.1 hypothetical protein PFL1_01084 [Pseudozyma flocculosa PF-1]SPO41858.1 related to Nuclease Le3 [Pseudozyma flocculosa]
MRLLALHTALVVLLCHLSAVRSWGLAGHQIVATIAQTQLHPLVRQHLCSILPNFTQYPSIWPSSPQGRPNTHCHLAVLAGWPDNVRFRLPWSSKLHYVNPTDDHPPQHCTYGEAGWTSDDNILHAMVNYTQRLTTETGYERDLALRFLVHFFGDAHQPLHLTGRARGGNDIWVHFEGRKSKLHSVWDGLLLNKQVRQLANYTSRLPSPRIESGLRGDVYDPYIRWILKEGLGQPAIKGQEPLGWFTNEAPEWPSCGTEAGRGLVVQQTGQSVFNDQDPSAVDDTDLPICPYYWTKPMHPLVCEYAFAHPVPEWEPPSDDLEGGVPEHPPSPPPPRLPLPELDTPEYLGRIDADKVIQRQLAKAGVRLAAVLNTLLLDEATRAVGGIMPVDWLDEGRS